MHNLDFEAQRELAAISYHEFHKIFVVFITVLGGSTLQIMDRPLETHYPEVVAFVVTVVFYFSLLLAELVLHINGRNHVIVNLLSLFLGVLAVISPILIIVPVVGWLALGIWVCIYGIVVYRFYDKIRDDFVKIVAEIVAKFRSVMNKLRNGNAIGSQGEQNGNAIGSQGEQNGNAIGSQGEQNGNAIGSQGEQNGNAIGSQGEQDGNANESGNEQNGIANESMDGFADIMPVNAV